MASNEAAKRYAKALFSLSTDKGVMDAVHQDLEALISMMSTSPEWQAFIVTPFGPLEKREQLLKDVLGSRIHDLTAKFLAFVNRKRRIQLLPDIFTAWLELHDEAHGILRAHATSATKLNQEQKNTLSARLGKRFNKDIILTTDEDDLMIGGLKVFIKDHVFDYSIESQLQHLQKEMLRA